MQPLRAFAMQHAIDYAELLARIGERFACGDDAEPRRRVRMVGIVFARPHSPITRTEILPQLNDWHHRSGNHIDFYFAGYSASSDRAPGYIEVKIPGARSWDYSSERFEAFREKFESLSIWKHSGSAELLLLNANWEPRARRVHLDFASLICCQLDLMKTDKAIQSVERFFESVFRFAETADDTDPTWSFSDKQGIDVAGSALKRVVLSLLPKGIEADYRRAEHFAVRDVSRP